nr:hypothetical protein CFP56_68375 [Quercus suber]
MTFTRHKSVSRPARTITVGITTTTTISITLFGTGGNALRLDYRQIAYNRGSVTHDEDVHAHGAAAKGNGNSKPGELGLTGPAIARAALGQCMSCLRDVAPLIRWNYITSSGQHAEHGKVG